METTPLYELRKVQTNFPKKEITSSYEASKFIKQFYKDDIEVFESCFLLLLNRANHTIGYAKISKGGITGTVVDVKLIAKYAVESLASGVILAHNHPSGNLNPSVEDKKNTEKTKKALEILDVTLLDHLILTSDNYYSLSDNGQM